ncbi:zinc finger of c3HC4-type, RING domain-containing protein [Phthorimaea operculella]|nr:zinc finger of c3HC4-type, RING domain-containing protein [Phthorimaea operculella]
MDELETTLEDILPFDDKFRKKVESISSAPTNSCNNPMVSSCRICLSKLMDPARLVCGHKFCETCLNKYWKANEEPNVIVCPLCRNYACTVGFEQKSYEHSIKAFRKKFDPDYVDMPSTHAIQSKIIEERPSYMSYVTWMIPILIMPALYLVASLVKPIVLKLFSKD